MNPFRCLAGVVLLAGLSVSANDSAAQPPKAQHHHGVHGVVDAVHHKQHTFTVHVRQTKGGKGAKGTHHERKFHVNQHTRFEIDGKHHKSASFAALRHGEHVVVHTAPSHPHIATRIEIHRNQRTTQVARK